MKENTFSKADRLRRRSEFLHVSNKGHRVQNSHVIIRFCPGRDNRTRLGITVTKRVGNAVTRNRIKRLCREYFRQNRERLGANLDLSIIAKEAAADLTSAELFISLESLFKKIDLHGDF